MPPTELHIENGVITQVESAKLRLWIGTEDWAASGKTLFGKPKYAWLYGPDYLRVRWSLVIAVDETSGEDAAAAPDFHVEIDGKAFPPLLEGVTGMKLVEGDVLDFNAYYGNDAPELEKNRFEFGEWVDRDHIMVRWSAEYAWGALRPEKIPFLFEGPVEFEGVFISVKKDEDAVPFLSQALPALDQSQLEMVLGQETVHRTREMPPDRRRWREVSWKRKAG